ncbi:TauD/TfdA family dioxygenase [Pseudorhodoferax sp. Leaf265]|jgi:alpha-ketoglutarate-dependent taurine dioxygenase|uniref:TauD/TfdA family dioxygenase n=1 Tax=Pseudorhodoferax sp. Leaf265 TaxID=1736315 RepID=UPI0006F52740|nr:TauD/TfdA family dioxygenase [Pseudorhodoferax sp. Leaf265]KQP15849.1 hypothetical protein ASF45_04565 [Pseudorhodoferax sp. Leaf265]
MNARNDAMHATRIEGPMAWTMDSLEPSSWRIPVPPAVTQEILDMLQAMRRAPAPFQAYAPEQFELQQTRAFLRGPVRLVLDHGIGICVLDRLPTEQMTVDEARAVYWVFSSLLGRPVAQKHNGNMMADVKDAGIPMKAGTAARGSTSRELLEFHNDGANTPRPPEYVGLLMLQEPKSGGLSRAFSVISGYNWLLEHHPEVLPRLYEDFAYFRMREHDPAEPACMVAPFLHVDKGVLKARVGPYQMKSAFEMGEADMDDATADAVAALDELFAQDQLVAEFYMAPGQLQFVNNQVIVHSRTEFVDNDEEGKRRHLLRIWLRDQGDPSYNGR